ncbi:MAG: sulfur carrier protein ThiS [Solirubrobacterales bacterium]|nr:sulfur carrier protein ThiS [Solirubrobacterales bacterium]MBV9423835.1 sulfur carrier protein ThiS [Solirubrobacterales bacterium]
MSSTVVTVNGEPRELDAGATVADLVALLAATPDGRGVAVAVDGEVVPRGAWQDTELVRGAQIEVLVAVQGG